MEGESFKQALLFYIIGLLIVVPVSLVVTAITGPKISTFFIVTLALVYVILYRRWHYNRMEDEKFRKIADEYYASMPDNGEPPGGQIRHISIDKDGKTRGEWR